jgi:hypothetical protein
LILYRSANDTVRVEVLYESETFWLDQRRIAELFGVDVRTVSEPLRNVYTSGELSEEGTLRKVRMVRTEGRREVAREIVLCRTKERTTSHPSRRRPSRGAIRPSEKEDAPDRIAAARS